MTVDLCQCVEVDDRAHDRVTGDHGRFLRDVWNQIGNPPQHDVLERLLNQLGKCALMLVENREHATPSDSEVRQELVKAGVLLTVLAADGTAEYTYPST
jgi:hypothetical protein